MTRLEERLRRSAAHLLVDDLESPVIDGETHHHLARVLRLKHGAEVTLTDGRGSWSTARWTGTASPEPTGSVVIVARPNPPLCVAFAPTKGDRPEWVVQKLTELGIDRIVPVITQRSVVRWDGDRARKQVERWQRIAREALSQSRGVFLPEVQGVTPLAVLAGAEPLRLAEPGGDELRADATAVVIGPEGGFAPDELALATGTVSLPGGVLRAETAAVAAGVLLAAARERGGA